MEVVDELKAVRARVTECIALASAHFQREFAEIPVKFDLAGTTAAMYCRESHPVTGSLIREWFRFNRGLIRENLAHYLGDTCPHEVAHYVVRSVWNHDSVKAHGREWQSVMVDIFNLPPERCHQLDTSRVAKRPFLYTCGCTEHYLSTVRHNRAQRGAKYGCKKCGMRMMFVKAVDAVPAPAPLINKLFISTGESSVGEDRVDKVLQLITDHEVRQIVTDGLITNVRDLQMLSKKMKVPIGSVIGHPNPNTLPAGISHAIVFADKSPDRQERVAKAFELRGVKVRLLRGST